MPVNVFVHRVGCGPREQSPAKSKESSTAAIDQNGATRPMFVEHPVHLLKRRRLAPIQGPRREGFLHPTLALRMSAARRDPRNAREFICDILQEIVESDHAN
jgi:hypothetical protein